MLHLFVRLVILVFELSLAFGSDKTREKKPMQPSHGQMESHILYFLSIFPYPNPEPSLSPFLADGPDLFPAVQLAVGHVNNRSDVLRDYHIELIETDGGCDISSKALISLVSQLFHSDKQIAGIIGPSCSESAEAVGALSRRSEIALLSIHLGSSPLLVNRTAYPYSVGMGDSPADEITAYIDLMKQAKWNRISALYNTDVLVDYTGYQLFEREAKTAGIDIVLTGIVSKTYIPYEELKESHARVIIAFVGDELAAQLLCVAYHNNLVYPTYQWILRNSYYVEGGTLSFYYQPEGREYYCTEEDLSRAAESEVFLELDLPTEANGTETVSGLSQREVFEQYMQVYSDYNISTTLNDVRYTFLAYDSVWAMALALNGSLKTLQEKNMSLTNYTYGQSNATEVILEHLYQLEFLGASGLISFNDKTGFIHRQPHYYHNPLVENSFEAVTIKVAIGLAVVVILVIGVTSVLVAFVHILNTVYENYKTIKASSSRLNHFAYVGCYCFLLALLAYTIVEAFSTSPLATTVLCNFIPWLTSIGFSLVFGTVIVKTWRVYVIFIRYELKSCKKTHLKDFPLSLIMVCFSAVNIILCTVWSVSDPLRYFKESTINIEQVTEEVGESCTCEIFLLWLALAVVYNGFLVTSAVFLAYLTRRVCVKEFKTSKNTTLLVYLLFLVTGLGIPVYFITWSLDAHVNISYTILCAVVTTLVYLCWGLLFLPPVLPLLREKFKKKGIFCSHAVHPFKLI